MEKQLIINGQAVTLQDVKQENDSLCFTLEGKAYRFDGRLLPDGRLMLEDAEQKPAPVAVSRRGSQGQRRVMGAAWEALVALPGKRRTDEAGSGDGTVRVPMTGTVVSVLVAVGDKVTKGQKLLVVEAMKLQLGLEAPCDGVVEALTAVTGGQVSQGQGVVKVVANA